MFTSQKQKLTYFNIPQNKLNKQQIHSENKTATKTTNPQQHIA